MSNEKKELLYDESFEEYRNSSLEAEVRSRLGNIINDIRLVKRSETEGQGTVGKLSYNISDDEEIISIYPCCCGDLSIEFKNGGTINIVGKNYTSIDIAYSDRPESIEGTFLLLELDSCYKTLINLPLWAEQMTDAWCDEEIEKEEFKELVEDCKNKLIKLKTSALEYAMIRIQSTNISDKHQEDVLDRFILILSEYVKLFNPFTTPVNEDELYNVIKNRAEVADLACYFQFMEAKK